jgi:hypothetical protein
MSNIIVRIKYNWFNKKNREDRIKTLAVIIEEILNEVSMEYYDDDINRMFCIKINNLFTALSDHLSKNKFFYLYKYISNPAEFRVFLYSKDFVDIMLKADLERNLKYENYEEAEEIKKLIELNERR